MKKSRAIVTTIAIVGIVAIAILCWAISSRNKNQTDEAATDIDLSVLGSSDPSTLQPIRLPNSEEVVYVEWLPAEDVTKIDGLLRQFEQADADTAAEAGEMAWIYTETLPAIAEWFNPEFNLVEAYKASDHPSETDPVMDEIITALEYNLAKENANDIFYFRKGETGYRMSAGYYLLGYVYSGINHNQQ